MQASAAATAVDDDDGAEVCSENSLDITDVSHTALTEPSTDRNPGN